jgi:hypothetical protein
MVWQMIGEDIHLAPEPGNPPAVDHVSGPESEQQRLAGGEVKLIGHHDPGPSIVTLPPPLVGYDVEVRLAAANGWLNGVHGRDGDSEKHDKNGERNRRP